MGDSNNSDDEIIKANHSGTRTSENFKSRRTVKKHSKKYKVSLSDEMINIDDRNEFSNEENNETSNQFICCNYEYCDVLVFKPEIIDNLYCSFTCKQLDVKQKVTEEKTSSIDQKHLLTKLKNTVNKRKQLLTSCPENMLENVVRDEKLINNKQSIKENQSISIKIPEQKNTINDDFEDDSKVEVIVSAATKNTNLSTRQMCDDSNNSDEEIIKANHSGTRTSENFNTRRTVKKHSKKYKVSLSDEMINIDDRNEFSNEENNETSNQFINCKYEYCDVLVFKPEIIDNLYCSFTCKQLDVKQIVTEEKTSSIDQKHLLTKLKNTVNKRKRLLTSCPENILENVVRDEKLINNKPSIKENQFPLKLLLPINSPEAIDDNDDRHFDLKPFIKDKNVLKYMVKMQFRTAPKKLFDRPFPNKKNLFVVGQKLEGIDPKHQALFCIMTVSEVCGYRIKLHFDGYPDDYDFWVNADCPDLFYPGWCEMNSRTVQPPDKYEHEFDWKSYLRECQALPASKHNFVSTKNLKSCKNQHKFQIGGKLEALNRLTRTLSKQLIYVATVADILGNRIRIHFDGWTDDFDYWTDVTSTNIHPIRWCENNGQSLSQPSGYNYMKGKKPFNWTDYLEETNSEPVPEDAFIRRPLRDFSNKMMIEVVDLVVPRLLRIASVVDVRDNELKIVYDGFDNSYAYWVEDDSPDIHPVGWSSKTNHPIELPPAPNTFWSCGIQGCKGYGNSSHSLKIDHVERNDCPYEMDTWKRAVAGLLKVPDRLKANNISITTTLTSSKSKSNVHQYDANKEKDKINTEHMNLVKIKEKINEKRLNFLLDANNIEPECDTDIKSTCFNNTPSSKTNKELCKQIGLSLLGYNLDSVSMDPQCRYWTRYNAQLDLQLYTTTDARKWSVQEVASYVQKVVTCYYSKSNPNKKEISIPDRFIDQEIDGETFLMLNQDDIMNKLKIPFGQAIKLFNAILMLRQQISVLD